jgi:MYXO-CTERM domain-containing protein
VAQCPETCTKVCDGSCTAQANAQCQIDCQTPVYTTCETSTVERCQTDCETTGGAIFCDGQFLSASDIDACAAQLSAEFDIQVDVMASVSVTTSGTDSDDGEPKNTINCAVAPMGPTGGGPGKNHLLALFGLGALGLLSSRRRRRAPVAGPSESLARA